MLRLNRGAVLAAATIGLAALSGQASASFLLTGNYVQLPVADSGNLLTTQGGKYNTAGTGGGSGVDFWYPGSPVYNYSQGIAAGSFVTDGSGWSVAPTIVNGSAGSNLLATITGRPFANLVYTRTISFSTTSKVVRFTDTFSNIGTTTFTNIATLDNTDPDQDSATTFITNNDVNAAGNVVTATGPTTGLTLLLGSPRAGTVASATGFSDTDPYGYTTVVDPNGAAGDIGINLVLQYGSLAAGQSTSGTWFMVFGSSLAEATASYNAAVPEPATLGLAAAGCLLTLRRRR